jgi:hypothetical protein
MRKLDVTHEFLLLFHFTSVMPCRDRLFIQIFSLMLQKKHVSWLKTIMKFEMLHLKFTKYVSTAIYRLIFPKKTFYRLNKNDLGRGKTFSNKNKF